MSTRWWKVLEKVFIKNSEISPFVGEINGTRSIN